MTKRIYGWTLKCGGWRGKGSNWEQNLFKHTTCRPLLVQQGYFPNLSQMPFTALLKALFLSVFIALVFNLAEVVACCSSSCSFKVRIFSGSGLVLPHALMLHFSINHILVKGRPTHMTSPTEFTRHVIWLKGRWWGPHFFVPRISLKLIVHWNVMKDMILKEYLRLHSYSSDYCLDWQLLKNLL